MVIQVTTPNAGPTWGIAPPGRPALIGPRPPPAAHASCSRFGGSFGGGTSTKKRGKLTLRLAFSTSAPHPPQNLFVMFALKSATAVVAVPTVAPKKAVAMRTWKAAGNKVSWAARGAENGGWLCAGGVLALCVCVPAAPLSELPAQSTTCGCGCQAGGSGSWGEAPGARRRRRAGVAAQRPYTHLSRRPPPPPAPAALDHGGGCLQPRQCVGAGEAGAPRARWVGVGLGSVARLLVPHVPSVARLPSPPSPRAAPPTRPTAQVTVLARVLVGAGSAT